MNMTHATDENPVESNDTVHHAPEEANVQRLLQEGPQGPQGRVAMAAAGIDVDGRFPVDAADEHLSETAETAETAEDGMDSTNSTNSAEAPTAPISPPEPTSAAEPPAVRESLLTSDDEREFLSRWNTIQIGFVEDPAQSVRDADALIKDISTAYVTAITERRGALSTSWQNIDAGTEEMRQAVLQYRALLGVVLPG
jgi:hypothetical protein